LNFVVVGGGPTGVEMAGAIAEIARGTLVKDFRHIDSSQARVILIDAGKRVLSNFAADLSESAEKQLTDIGVEIHKNSHVELVSEAGVQVEGGAFIPARTIVWAAGNAASPLGASLGVPMDRGGRVIVKEDLSVPGHPSIFVIGDMANFAPGGEGTLPLPGLSPVAIQQGRHAAKNIGILLSGGWTEKFEYIDRGTMATIGRNRAVADLGWVRFGGMLAWLAWAFIHLLFLIGFRDKVMVMLSWIYAYVTYGRGARLITGRDWRAKAAALE
jgi:NADH dehydrogenase